MFISPSFCAPQLSGLSSISLYMLSMSAVGPPILLWIEFFLIFFLMVKIKALFFTHNASSWVSSMKDPYYRTLKWHSTFQLIWERWWDSHPDSVIWVLFSIWCRVLFSIWCWQKHSPLFTQPSHALWWESNICPLAYPSTINPFVSVSTLEIIIHVCSVFSDIPHYQSSSPHTKLILLGD